MGSFFIELRNSLTPQPANSQYSPWFYIHGLLRIENGLYYIRNPGTKEIFAEARPALFLFDNRACAVIYSGKVQPCN